MCENKAKRAYFIVHKYSLFSVLIITNTKDLQIHLADTLVACRQEFKLFVEEGKSGTA